MPPHFHSLSMLLQRDYTKVRRPYHLIPSTLQFEWEVSPLIDFCLYYLIQCSVNGDNVVSFGFNSFIPWLQWFFEQLSFNLPPLMGIVLGLYDIGVTVLCKPLPDHPLACVLPQPHSHTILIRAATQGISSVSESIILLKASLSEIHVTPPQSCPLYWVKL